jgi:hypothetical protein
LRDFFPKEDIVYQQAHQAPSTDVRLDYPPNVSVMRKERLAHVRVLPIFKWVFDSLARMLGFIFLYNGGLAQLQSGYRSPKTTNQVKAYLTTLLILSAIQLIPAVLFDTTTHMGALWGFLVPVLLFTCPDWNADQPIAVMICDSVFATISLAISSVIPASVQVSLSPRGILIVRVIKVKI